MNKHIPFVSAATIALIVLGKCQVTLASLYIDPNDPFTGWFMLESPQTRYTSPEIIIPVFKINEAYYSVCRGVEIPFKRSPEGYLEWALEPSSMEGTRISFSENLNRGYIIIKDSRQPEETSESIGKSGFQLGLNHMTKIDKPTCLLNPTISPARKNDDFIGCYQPAWFPYYRFEVQKDGKTYFALYLEQYKDDKWQQNNETIVLTPLHDRLGFEYPNSKKKIELTYNEILHRFEMVLLYTNPATRMPLARIPQSPLDQNQLKPYRSLQIGIPSWQ